MRPDPTPADRLGPGPILLAIAVISGALVRGLPFLGADFPLGDGGLFATMIGDISANGLVPPPFTSYNGGGLPFAYPPFAFEFAAILQSALGISTLDLLRVVPIIVSVATIPACFLFLRRLMEDETSAALATVAFAVAPRSYAWLIVGGGLTRSFGLLFALLALWQAMGLLRHGGQRRAIVTGALAGLTALSHLSAAVFLAATAIILAWRYRRTMPVRGVWTALGVAFLIAAPWQLLVISRHGFGPLLAAGGSRIADLPDAFYQFLDLRFTDEFLFAPIAILGAIGLIIAVLEGPRWIVVWLISLFALTSGDATTYAMVPWAVLVAIAVKRFIWPLAVPRFRPMLAAVALGLAIAGSAWTSFGVDSPLHSVPTATRAAMGNAGAELTAASRVLVVSGSRWGLDATAEWFPLLSGRLSVATVQGNEFAPAGQWNRAIAQAKALEECSEQGLGCLEAWSREYDVEFDAVFIPKGWVAGSREEECCGLLRHELQEDPNWTVVTDDAGATLFRSAP